MHDFQFYDRERLEDIYAQESELIQQKREQIGIIRELRLKESQEQQQASFKKQKKEKRPKTEADLLEEQLATLELPEDVQEEKAALLSDGTRFWGLFCRDFFFSIFFPSDVDFERRMRFFRWVSFFLSTSCFGMGSSLFTNP